MNNFTQVPNEILENKDLTIYEKAILAYLLKFKPCYPKIEQICEDCDIGKTKANEVIQQLQQQNIIKVKKNSGHWHNEYFIQPVDQWQIVRRADKKKKKIIAVRTATSSQGDHPYNKTKINHTNLISNISSKDVTTSSLDSIRIESKRNYNTTSYLQIDSNNINSDVRQANVETFDLIEFETLLRSNGLLSYETWEYFQDKIGSMYSGLDFGHIENLIRGHRDFDELPDGDANEYLRVLKKAKGDLHVV
jgi:predicted transcriptional regulator